MNIIYDKISEHVDKLIEVFNIEGRNSDSEWLNSLVSHKNMQSDFQSVCNLLIGDKRVLPLFLRNDPCVFIFRESELYFRVRFLVNDETSDNILILIDFQTSVRMFPDIQENGCDDKFMWSNIVDFCVCAVAGQRRRFQEFPASDFIVIKEWYGVISKIKSYISIIPVRISTSELVFKSGGMIIYCSYYSLHNNDDYDDSDQDESETIIELYAEICEQYSMGCLE